MPRRLFQTPHEWPLERVRVLRGMAALGLPPAAIARELGISTAAVVAKAYRLGIKIAYQRQRPSAPRLLNKSRNSGVHNKAPRGPSG
jgi:hypothetical protein